MKKTISVENMVDICGGKMTMDELCRELQHYMRYYADSKRMIVVIDRTKNKYLSHSTIYIPKEDFGKER